MQKITIFKAMSVKVHEGQTQIVEGSAVGHFFVTPKMFWGPCGSLVYLGECKTASNDSDNNHFIQKFLYDTSYNVIRVLIAQNISTLGCTDVSLKVLSPRMVEVTLNNGDFSEVNKDDSFTSKTAQDITGRVFKKVSDTICHIEVNVGTAGLIDETNVIINETDLTVRFESDKTKWYTCRRWDHRDRYSYA